MKTYEKNNLKNLEKEKESKFNKDKKENLSLGKYKRKRLYSAHIQKVITSKYLKDSQKKEIENKSKGNKDRINNLENKNIEKILSQKL